MKRRVGMKNASQTLASVQAFNSNHFRAKRNANSHNSGVFADTSEECRFPKCPFVILAQNGKPASKKEIAHATAPITTEYSSSSSTSLKPAKQVVVHENVIANPLTTYHLHSSLSFTQGNGHILNLNAPTTLKTHSHLLAHVERSCCGTVVPLDFPISDGHL